MNENSNLNVIGLYCTDYVAPDNYAEVGYYSYLKFCKNGNVVGVSTATDSKEKVLKWLKCEESESNNLSTGKYFIKGNDISFTLESENGKVDYKGIINGKNIIFDTFSHINKFVEHSRHYKFI